MNELIIQLITISIVLFIAFVGFAIIAINNWNKLEIKKRSVAVLRKERDDAKNNEIETTSAYLSMCNKCDRQNNMVRKLNRENLQLRDTNERVSDDYHTVTDLNDTLQSELRIKSSITSDLIRKDRELLCKDNKNKSIIKELQSEIVDMKILLACKVDELEKPQVVKSKLSKADLEMMRKATSKMTLLVNSMPMNDDIQLEMFDQYNQYLADLKHVQESLLIWKNDEFYLLPIKTMSDLVDTIDTIIKKVDIDAPKFTKVLEVARAKIVLALDNKPQNKE